MTRAMSMLAAAVDSCSVDCNILDMHCTGSFAVVAVVADVVERM